MTRKNSLQKTGEMMTNYPTMDERGYPIGEIDMSAGRDSRHYRPPMHETPNDDVAKSRFETSAMDREKIENEFNRMDPKAGRAYLTRLMDEGMLEADIDLPNNIMLSMRRLLGENTFDSVHYELILHRRGTEQVAQSVTDVSYAKLFIKVFGIEGVRFLPEEFQVFGKRRVLEDGLGL